jgi:dimethylglycine dehydrogenase
MTRYFYENRSEKIFPYQSFPVARPQAVSPIHHQLQESGAVFGTGFGREHVTWFAPEGMTAEDSLTYRQPNWWKPVAEEGKQLRHAAGLFEFSDMAKFKISGSNAAAWLDHLMANRLPEPGRICLSPMLSHNGFVIGDFTISHLGDYFLVIGTYAMQLAFMRHFKQHLPADGVVVENISDQLSGLAIAGPEAQNIMSQVTDAPYGFRTHFDFWMQNKSAFMVDKTSLRYGCHIPVKQVMSYIWRLQINQRYLINYAPMNTKKSAWRFAD